LNVIFLLPGTADSTYWSMSGKWEWKWHNTKPGLSIITGIDCTLQKKRKC